MILNPNDYRRNLDAMHYYLHGKEVNKDLSETITLLSIGSHVPLAAVVSYALRPEVCGEHPILRHMLKETIDFYKYEEVMPWLDQ